MLAPCLNLFAQLLVFVASFGPRFFEHRFCIVFGSIVNEFVYRQFSDISFSQRTLCKNTDSQVQKFHRLFNDCPSIRSPFPIILDHYVFVITLGIHLCIDFYWFGIQSGYLVRKKSRLVGWTVSSRSRPGADLGATCGPKRPKTLFW